MQFKIISLPQTLYEDKKSGTAGQRIEKYINDMAAEGYEYVGVIRTSSEVHSGCCCCKQVGYRYENQLVFKK